VTAPIRLDPADIDAIAERVSALMRNELQSTPVRYVDAGTLAQALGVDRALRVLADLPAGRHVVPSVLFMSEMPAVAAQPEPAGGGPR
jgi:hypothetical protein